MERLSFQKAKGMWVGFFGNFNDAAKWLSSLRNTDPEESNALPEQQRLTEKFFKGKMSFSGDKP